MQIATHDKIFILKFPQIHFKNPNQKFTENLSLTQLKRNH